MAEYLHISRTKELPKGLDFEALRLEGIRYAQQLSGKNWTDYNEHDPGVTLLEYFCFALTDLSYRANFDITDLLYATDGKGQPKIANAFYQALDILPTTPVTLIDYRRLLIDRVFSVRNAWIEPIRNHPHGYKGLFRIRIQLTDEVNELRTQNKDEIIDEVTELIMEHRNLCEDLAEVIVLKTECLDLAATINILPDAFGEKVIARIIHEVEQMLNPGVRYYTKEELLAEGYSISEIFNGPEPLHGFIKSEDLKPLPESTSISTLREVIAGVEGVKMVQNLTVWKEGKKINGDEIIPSPDSALSLDQSLADTAGSPDGIILLRNGIPVSLNHRQIRQYLNTMSAKARKGFQLALDLNEPSPTSNRRLADIKKYHSFQHLLPTVYGLGADGLPHTASRANRAKAKQLKGFLLFFEQLMASYLAQLANVRNLFSIETENWMAGQHLHADTYFTQFPFDIPDVLPLLIQEQGTADDPKSIEEAIQKLSQIFDPADERRNRFLNHLMARFGEEYSGDLLSLLTVGDKENFTHQLISGKSDFLRHCKELSRNRGKAFNYRQEAWGTSNVSGLKKRIALLLGLDHHEDDNPQNSFTKYFNRNLSNIPPLANQSEGHNEPAAAVKVPFRGLLKSGQEKEHYLITANESTGYDLLFLPADSEQKHFLFNGTEAECERVLENIRTKVLQVNTYGEGFFLLENILLRPTKVPGSVLVLKLPALLDDQALLLWSLNHSNTSELENINSELAFLTGNPENWSEMPIGEGGVIVLCQEGIPLLVSDYLEAGDFKVAKNNALKQSLRIRNDGMLRINDYVDYESEKLPGHGISSDFYSLRLSIVAPDWPSLFQERDFQHYFQQVVALQIPAHLTVDYYWLDLAEMKRFELDFARWLENKKNGNDEKAEQVAMQIAELLTGNNHLQENQPSSNDTTRRPSQVLRKLGETYGWGFAFQETQLEIIAGLPDLAIELLASQNVTSWKDLSRINTEEWQATLTRNELTTYAETIESWRDQARFARNNKWKELLRYQEKLDLKQEDNSLAAEVEKWLASKSINFNR